MTNAKSILLLAILLVSVFASASGTLTVAAFAPQAGNYFKYSETITLNNGTGTYLGYTEQENVTGIEQINGVNGSIVSAYYSYTYNWSNNQGSSTEASKSGNYTFNDNNFLYVNGTDDQIGYVNPTVWFAMNNSLPTGSTFYLLNTQMTILSENSSYFVPTLNENIKTIATQGSGSYYGSPDNNAYGMFNAHYTWKEYFDPSSGYVVGYNYVEQDNNGSFDSFTYTDNLYATSTSYPLTTEISTSSVFSSSTTTTTQNSIAILMQYLGYIIAIVAVFAVIVIIIIAMSRRSKAPSLPKHAELRPSPMPPPSQPPPPTDIHLTQSQPSQVVMRETVTINCKFCGTAYDIRLMNCPKCGAPRT